MPCSSYRGVLVKPGNGLTRRPEARNLSCGSVLPLTPGQLHINSLFTLSGQHPEFGLVLSCWASVWFSRLRESDTVGRHPEICKTMSLQ